VLIIRNIILVIGFVFLVIGCEDESAQSSQRLNVQNIEAIKPDSELAESVPDAPLMSTKDMEICADITDGKILVSTLSTPKITRNSFYLDCTLSPFIGTVKATQQDRDKARLAQINNAAYLFSQDIDPNHMTVDGGRLLHMVIGSELNENEKIRWLKRLVNDGADVNFMNAYGNEALRAATYQDLPVIYDWLLENGAKASLPAVP